MQCADGAIVGPPPQLTDSLGEPGEAQVATVAMHAIDVGAGATVVDVPPASGTFWTEPLVRPTQ
jgi:hypothetical protein